MVDYQSIAFARHRDKEQKISKEQLLVLPYTVDKAPPPFNLGLWCCTKDLDNQSLRPYFF